MYPEVDDLSWYSIQSYTDYCSTHLRALIENGLTYIFPDFPEMSIYQSLFYHNKTESTKMVANRKQTWSKPECFS